MINNLILRTILEDIKDQNDPNIINWTNILLDKEALEQKKISSVHGTRLQLANKGHTFAN